MCMDVRLGPVPSSVGEMIKRTDNGEREASSLTRSNLKVGQVHGTQPQSLPCTLLKHRGALCHRADTWQRSITELLSSPISALWPAVNWHWLP